MLRKTFFGLVATGMMIAPTAAFAQDQVQGSVTNTNISTVNVGNGNITGVTSDSNTTQIQNKYGNPWCASGNQIQGSSTNTGVATANVGHFNVTGVATGSHTSQVQNAGCGFPYFPY